MPKRDGSEYLGADCCVFCTFSLAYCELYLTLAAIFAPRKFKKFELFETGVRDVEVWHDFFNACQRVESKGIRVRIE